MITLTLWMLTISSALFQRYPCNPIRGIVIHNLILVKLVTTHWKEFFVNFSERRGVLSQK